MLCELSVCHWNFELVFFVWVMFPCEANVFSPVLTVDDLQVHVDSGDEHLTVDANLIDCGRREGVSHHHHPHDLIGH